MYHEHSSTLPLPMRIAQSRSRRVAAIWSATPEKSNHSTCGQGC